ncbi:MAG: glycoside hydrolase family 3 C-terminal domain-containing protein [Clostridiales Family XIII bacterium]|nr:glycoside hydrolase family 3 C-terminal domain-containing protein [Clostridiales Family XIII bacterium]
MYQIPAEIVAAVDSLLAEMTLEEKLGQMSMSVGAEITAIGGSGTGAPIEQSIREGRVGATIQVAPPLEMARRIRELQRIAVEESRLGIPLLFCQDVIHGFETVFPIPLAQACSFDPRRVREVSAVAAAEAGSCGIMLTFAPMADLVRDPRWGRAAESFGEDPYLASIFARATTEGFQGEDLRRNGGIAACIKHYIGYGAAEGGRDYNTAEIGETTLRNYYLPPFAACVAADIASVMPSFNVIDGIPMTANKRLLSGLLREELGFEGVMISDYTAVTELIAHGVAADEAEAAEKAVSAGVDIEMTSACFLGNLRASIEKGVVKESVVDDAVRRILSLKHRLGIMKDPYKFLREDAFAAKVYSAPHLKSSRELAIRSCVLLKNDGILPIDEGQRVALIGPFGDSADLCGCWSFSTRREETCTIARALTQRGVTVDVCAGCDIDVPIPGGIEKAVNLAAQSDVILLALGEPSVDSGEASSRMDLELPAVQRDLANALIALGKPIALILTNGRPLLLDWFDRHMNAILEIWAPGSEGGAAVAELLLGKESPTGKLAMSFPRHMGQIPVYYNALPTGRPWREGDSNRFLSQYIDGPNAPLYPFGFGLTYTSFACGGLTLSRDVLHANTEITAGITLSNTGARAGEETVQLYIRDESASVSRPVKELKGFQKITLSPGERAEVSFRITEEMLRFYRTDGVYTSEPGIFEVMIGTSSADADLLRGRFLFKED